MAKKAKTDLTVTGNFDYSALAPQVAKGIQSAVRRIVDRVKRTVADIIEIGNDLRAVKEALPHGQFGAWLEAEFGWSERLAQNFLNVASRFGEKAEIIADLRIAPTAAYLLAAPSVPDEAREAAISRAEAGEQITPAVAKDILAQSKEKGKENSPSAEQLSAHLAKALERYRDKWEPNELSELARQLREFADELERSRMRE
jgi:gas vesicle protein